jgi:phage terminase large subunit-like protein
MLAQSLNVSSIAGLPPEKRAEVLANLSDDECEALLHDWRFLARPAQMAPDGEWLIWMILAGRGFGKTRTGAEWTREQVRAGSMRIGLIANSIGRPGRYGRRGKRIARRVLGR